MSAFEKTLEFINTCSLEDLTKELTKHGAKVLPHFTWPGGYPLYYIDKDNNIYCPDCANKFISEITTYDIHWEGKPFICKLCGRKIESAYGK